MTPIKQIALIALLLASMASLQAETARTGWHDEPMPDGMQRGEKHGLYIWERDGSQMVFVPAGSFTMGSNDGHPDERPQREVWLDGYYIDRYEVSWRQWKLSGLSYSQTPNSRRMYPEAPDWGIVDEHPVGNVAWEYARKYAQWAGKRLPTEAQWEKAARGSDARTYPWGNEAPTPERAVWRDHPIAAVSVHRVDCCPEGASPYGAENMAGNVYEWVEDVYDRDFYATGPNRNPLNDQPGPYRVLRGGAVFLELEDLRSALRYRLFPDDRVDYLGFRTAVPLRADAAK